ncbi:MAG: sulfite exporter TauE/SafE family protein [Acidiferrobacterales bacterium]
MAAVLGILPAHVDIVGPVTLGDSSFDIDPPLLVLAALVLALGGVVKGSIGVGLPVVVIAVLSHFLPAPIALALVTFPILLTNLWQAIHAGRLMEPLKRFWPMIGCLILFIWISARLVVSLDPRVLYAMIGATVTSFAITNYLKIVWTVRPSSEKWAAPLAGSIGGFLGGISTIWGPPMMMYFIMLRLPKEAYIQAVGLIWFIASIPLVIAYIHHGILTAQTAPLSLLACIPGFAGLAVGQMLRKRINQEMFRKVLLLFLFVIGLNLIRRSIF